MLFTLLGHPSQVPKTAASAAFLVDDNWDDWGKFRTMFQLVVFDHEGSKRVPGSVKIGELGLRPATSIEMRPGFRAPTIPREFDALNERHFSLGTNENYYETLNQLPLDLRDSVLKGLNDCAFNLELFDRFIDEQVMLESLLRDISDDNVRNRYHRLAMGDARLTEFWFEYAFSPTEANTASPVLTFHVVPHSEPPTNIHVLIGRNGAGKTRCLQHLARAILTTDPIWGQIRQLGSDWNKWEFAGLVFVSFSAFDQFDFPESKRRDMRASLVSLRPSTPERETTKTPMELARDFYESFLNCSEGLKAIRWAEAIKTLENDPLFAEAEVGSLLNVAKRDLLSQTISLFSALSSGHAIVLLTITQLVDLVDERTLVLLEEPEGHLHPPLLSAFIRAVADLLIKRNGVAIVATHSPVVLQEVPKTCVTVLRRTGNFAVAEQPTIETFGENVGVLTHAVFGLEVTTAGFHQILRRLVEDELLNYEEVRERFAGQLGAEARTIVRALISERDSQ